MNNINYLFDEIYQRFIRKSEVHTTNKNAFHALFSESISLLEKLAKNSIIKGHSYEEVMSLYLTYKIKCRKLYFKLLSTLS